MTDFTTERWSELSYELSFNCHGLTFGDRYMGKCAVVHMA